MRIKWNAFRVWRWLLGLAFLSTVQAAWNQAPTGQDRASIFAEGFAAAANRIGNGLADGYKSQAQNSGKEVAFTQWLDLWRWCDLLSRNTSMDNAALVQRYFFHDSQSNQLILCRPGIAPPDVALPLTRDEATLLMENPEIRNAILNDALPPGSALESVLLTDILGKDLAVELMNEPEFLRLFFSTCDGADFLPLVLRNLRDIRQSYPAKWREYQNLALALAVVNDSALPGFWPHPQVSPQFVQKDVPPVAQQFVRWVEANESHKLLLDLRKLRPDQLKFVVDGFLKNEEMSWARKNIRFHVGNYSEAFAMIPYRDDRIQKKRYFWDERPYTFYAIQKNGGICIDQAYFAAFTGKALGLPTILFSGQGTNGGHAWFGYMSGSNKWALDCGRDPNQNLVTGTALDPQSWKPVTDHDILQFTARFREKPEFLASTTDRTMAAIFEKANRWDDAKLALQHSVRICPENPEAWADLSDFLEQTHASSEERKSVHEQAAKALAKNPDAKVEHQQAIADLQRQAGKSKDAAQTEQQILTQNLSNRSDLSCEMAAARVNAAMEEGDITKASKEFYQQLQSIGKSGGGNFVNQVGVPFIRALVEKGQKTRARRAVEILRQKFEPSFNSPLDLQLRSLAKECK